MIFAIQITICLSHVHGYTDQQLEYEIERNGELVKLTTDCITFVAKRIV